MKTAVARSLPVGLRPSYFKPVLSVVPSGGCLGSFTPEYRSAVQFIEGMQLRCPEASGFLSQIQASPTHSTIGGLFFELALNPAGRRLIEATLALGRDLFSSDIAQHSFEFQLHDERQHIPLRLLKSGPDGDMREALSTLTPEQFGIWLADTATASFRRDARHWGAAMKARFSSLRISLLTWNVWGLPFALGFGSKAPWRYEAIAAKLKGSAYDVVALQEMWDRRTDVILHQSGFQYAAAGKKMHGLRNSSGLLTLSRYPIAASETLAFSQKSGIEHFVNKGALFTRVVLPTGQCLDIYNVHLASPPEGLNHCFTTDAAAAAIRAAQIKELDNWVNSRRVADVPVILMGDFNTGEESKEYLLLKQRFSNDLYRARYPCVDLCNQRTFLGHTFDSLANRWALGKGPTGRLDQIWLPFMNTDELTVQSMVTIPEAGHELSDHYGLATAVTFFGKYQNETPGLQSGSATWEEESGEVREAA